MLYTSRYYSSEYNLERELEETENFFDVSFLDKKIEYAIDDIKNLQEAIKRCQEYISFLIRQKDLAETITYKYEVHISRRSYSKPILYYTSVHKIPNVPNPQGKIVYLESKRWEGKERHLAKKHALELSKKYKCAIVDT